MDIHGLQARVPFDIDEMLLHITGDEYGGETPNGTGAPYLDLNINHRRRSEREADSSRPLPDEHLYDSYDPLAFYPTPVVSPIQLIDQRKP